MTQPDDDIVFEPLTEPDGSRPVSMDPRLQHAIARRRSAGAGPEAADDEMVGVIAKVTDPDRFAALAGVVMGKEIGDPAEDGTVIVTARVFVAALADVRADETVLSLKGAQAVLPRLAATTEEIGARPADLPAGSDGGRGVVVGVVDFGCAFAHHDFRNQDGSTRVRKLWNQNAAGDGVVFDRPGIDRALRTAKANSTNPYQELGYGPRPNRANHGTHVLGIAAGNGRGSGTPGVAPNADLVFVDLSSRDLPAQGPAQVGSSFGDSARLLDALAFVFEEAGTLPCSVNVSLGTNGGPHDGSTLVEQGIDRLLTQRPNRSVCVAASNSFTDGIHAAATVPAGGSLDVPWEYSRQDGTENELELWYSGDHRLSIEVLTPSGRSLALLRPGESGSATRAGGIVMFAANRLHDPNNGDNTIGVFLALDAPRGRWVLRLHNAGGSGVPFHAWIERDDFGPSSFDEPHDNSHTLGSISCGHKTIVVGSYDAHVPGTPLSEFSSSGPTRDERVKPEVSAPGHDVLSADSRSLDGTVRMSGTSMAAPAVTGAVALLLEAAQRRGLDLSVDRIREHVTSTARTDPPGRAPDSRYGHGRVSAARMIAALPGAAEPLRPAG